MLLVYGSYGYTGNLIVREARARGLPIVLAGRDRTRLEEQGEASGYDWRVFNLGKPDLSGITAVLHCAGPFVHTAAPMVDACLDAGVHYLDITGEVAVFEAIALRDAEAKARRVGLLPGVGFDVVPSDCLAAHVAARLPGADRLIIGIAARGGLSHGTASTALTFLDRPGLVRRDGRLEDVPIAWSIRGFDFDGRERTGATLPLGDVSTAFRSTGIPNIEVYGMAPQWLLNAWRWTSWTVPALRLAPVRRYLQARIDAGSPGPTDEERGRGWAQVVAEAHGPGGRVARAHLRTPEAYTFTAVTALEAGRIAATEGLRPGALTPSLAFGADWVTRFPGVTRKDLD